MTISGQILEWTKQMAKLTQQSIDLLSPKPKVAYVEEKPPMKGGGKKPAIKKSPRIYRVYSASVEVKPEIASIMKYQGIGEAQMQDALKTLKE